MHDSSQQEKKPKGFDAFITAVNIAAMGAGIAAAVIAANKGKCANPDAGKIEKYVDEVNAKFDKISQQLKCIQPKIEDPATITKEGEKKRENGSTQQQPKPSDVIYVRKSSDFSFYN